MAVGGVAGMDVNMRVRSRSNSVDMLADVGVPAEGGKNS